MQKSWLRNAWIVYPANTAVGAVVEAAAVAVMVVGTTTMNISKTERGAVAVRERAAMPSRDKHEWAQEEAGVASI